MRCALVTVFLLSLLGLSGCMDCGSRCDRDYRDCLESGRTIECDVGYTQCLDSCGTMAVGAADAG